MAVKKATIKKEKPVKKAAKIAKTAKPKAEKVVKVAKELKKPTHNASHSDAGGEKIVEAPAKEVKKETVEKIAKKTNEKYFYAVGRRKAAVAQVRLFEDSKATDNDLIINGKKFKDYFPTISLQNNFLTPLKAVGMQGNFSMTVIVRGGGTTGQVEAVRLGIARALVVYDDKLKKTLKDLGLLTRDSRKVERKKAGLKKARKSPQWAKR
jgi:small subunit ribosomal protein S9